MSIVGFRHLKDGVPPTAHEAPGGLASGTRTPHAGPGVAQHAALAGRAPRQDGTGAPSRRVALDLLSQSVGHRLGGDTINKSHVLNRVANGEVSLHNTYPPALLGNAVGVAVKGLAGLIKNFPGLL